MLHLWKNCERLVLYLSHTCCRYLLKMPVEYWHPFSADIHFLNNSTHPTVFRQRLWNETCPGKYVTSCIGAHKQNNFQGQSNLRGIYMFKVNIKNIRTYMFKVKCMFKINVLVFLFTIWRYFSLLVLIFLMLNLNK